MDPAGLWAAGVAEAEAAGVDVMHFSGSASDVPEPDTEHVHYAASTGMLLNLLPHLLSLALSMRFFTAALRLLVQRDSGARVRSLSLLNRSSRYRPGCELERLLLPAVTACTGLTSLHLAFPLSSDRSFVPLVRSNALRRLTSLIIPEQKVDQQGLDAILQCLPGEAAGVRYKPVVATRVVGCMTTWHGLGAHGHTSVGRKHAQRVMSRLPSCLVLP